MVVKIELEEEDSANQVQVLPTITASCAACKALSRSLRKCQACKSVQYCSVDCQTNHWQEHKPVCVSLRPAASSEQPQKKLSCKSYCATDASAWGHVALFYFGKKPPIGVESQLSCTARGQPKVRHSFRSVDDLPTELQFLVSCGFLPDLERVKRLCPMVDVNTLRLPGARFTALEWAARKGNFDIAQWLCKHGGADAKVGTPVLWACYTNNVRVAKHLVDDYGANLQAIDPGFGMAAIHISAENGQLGSVQWLVLDKGQDPSWRDATGKTSLDRVRGSVREVGTLLPGHRDVIAFLEGLGR